MNGKSIVAALLGPEPSGSAADGGMDPLEMIAQELIESVEAKDSKGVCEALRAAFECCDMQPHTEGSHEDDQEG